MSLRRCWLRVSHASGAPDHMLERPRDELETTAMKRFPAVNPSPSSVAPEPRVDVDFLGPRGQSTQRAQQGRAPSLFCPALPCFGRRSGLPCPALPCRSFPLWLPCPALPCGGFWTAFAFSLDLIICLNCIFRSLTVSLTTQRTPSPMAALPFKRIIGNPYSRYLGQPVRVVGAWWPGTSGAAAKMKAGNMLG